MNAETLLSLTSVGLAFDLLGVTLLGVAFFITPISSLLKKSQSFFGHNPTALKANIETRTDGVCGTALLVVGFMLQWLGANSFNHPIAGIILYGFLIVFTICYFIFIRKFFVTKQTDNAIALEKEEERERKERREKQ